MGSKTLHLTAAIAAVVSALALAGGASAEVRFGVADDGGKYADDGGASFFSILNAAGLQANRITVLWDPTDGTDGRTIREAGFLDRALPVAALRGVDVVLSVYPAKAKVFAVDTQKRIDLFAEFLQIVARRYPTVETFIVGNEPNQPRFWQPQFLPHGRGGHRAVAGALYERLLAAGYDALKAVDPKLVVVGLGLSPRGNDNPRAPNNVSRSPVRFIADLAAEYRRSGRTKPIMDALGFHPYPQSNADPHSRGYSWPNAGLRDLDRIKQAIWDGFHGTAQPVFAEPGDGAGPALRLMLDEYGRQAVVIASVRSAYSGRENVKPVDEGTQARLYVEAVREVACEPAVSDFFLFHLVDEADLDRFQSGLLRADGTRRPSFDSVRAAIGEGCRRAPHVWRHAETVVAARVSFDGFRVRATAREEARVTAAVFPARTERGAILAALTRRAARATGHVVLRAHRRVTLGLRTGELGPGTYVTATLLRATLNLDRATLVVSRPFWVG